MTAAYPESAPSIRAKGLDPDETRAGLNLCTRGQMSEMYLLRLFALLTMGCMIGLAILTAFMNTPPRRR